MFEHQTSACELFIFFSFEKINQTFAIDYLII